MALSVIALIPARGGSKRIVDKNIRPLAGKPLLQYTVECAKAAGLPRIIVSTDSPRISEVALECGAEVPFLRPAKLAEDHVPDFLVVDHCLDYLEEKEDWVPDILVFLRPPMPLRKPEEIRECLQLLESNPDADCVRTTSPVPYPPFWVKRLNARGLLEPYCEYVRPYQYIRSQDLPQTVFCDGYVDITRVSVIREYNQLYAGRILACHSGHRLFVDLDEEKDWRYAEYLMSEPTTDN